MTASNFDDALKRVLVHEGGYVNHPADPGGATNKGVTQRVYDGWRRRHGKPVRSVKGITGDEVAAIYRQQYWDAIRADELPAGVDYCTFDAAVNSGPGQAAKWLQRALSVSDDGQIGEATLAAARSQDAPKVINGSCDRRLSMLRGLRTFRTFGAGWTRRVADVRKVALDMAAKAPLPPVASDPVAQPGAPKATAEDRSLADIAKSPEGVGGIIAVGSAALNTASDPTNPLAWALAFAVVVAIGVGAFYFVRRMRAAG